ncbi:hypothetical protein BC829DRAFT_434679 [Chytridium lagenaria]|nr:hypothetical protein BC829DRAFT_434679 [Chytridium lagenaria]
MDPMQIVACKMMGVPFVNAQRAAAKLSWQRQFRSFYGVSRDTADKLWELAAPHFRENRLSLKDFLCFMFYLKNYPTDAIGCNFMKRSESTYRERMARCLEAFGNVNTTLKIDGSIGTQKLLQSTNLNMRGTDIKLLQHSELQKSFLSRQECLAEKVRILPWSATIYFLFFLQTNEQLEIKVTAVQTG